MSDAKSTAKLVKPTPSAQRCLEVKLRPVPNKATTRPTTAINTNGFECQTIKSGHADPPPLELVIGIVDLRDHHAEKLPIRIGTDRIPPSPITLHFHG